MLVLTKGETFDLLAEHIAIFEVDMRTGVINGATKTLERMFGYGVSGELEGESIELLIPSSLRGRHAKEHRPAFAADPQPRLMGRHMDLRGQRKDGSVFPVEVMLLPRAANRVRVIVGVVFDMSVRTEPTVESADRAEASAMRVQA